MRKKPNSSRGWPAPGFYRTPHRAPQEMRAAIIHYGTPYSTEGRIGRAYNQFMALLPQPTDFGCLVDADAVFTTCDFGHLIQRVVAENPTCRLFYARTNRIGCPWQLDD